MESGYCKCGRKSAARCPECGVDVCNYHFWSSAIPAHYRSWDNLKTRSYLVLGGEALPAQGLVGEATMAVLFSPRGRCPDCATRDAASFYDRYRTGGHSLVDRTLNALRWSERVSRPDGPSGSSLSGLPCIEGKFAEYLTPHQAIEALRAAGAQPKLVDFSAAAAKSGIYRRSNRTNWVSIEVFVVEEAKRRSKDVGGPNTQPYYHREDLYVTTEGRWSVGRSCPPVESGNLRVCWLRTALPPSRGGQPVSLLSLSDFGAAIGASIRSNEQLSCIRRLSDGPRILHLKLEDTVLAY